jgi:predicted DCC family thiol-disulfide oxidoreductase YuxK
MENNAKTEVLYNASCPVCSKEIDHYAALTEKHVLPIGYDDLNDPEKLARWGLSPEAAAKRLHVRKDGQTLSGVPAFIALWREIPRYRWVARIVSVPGLFHLASAVYDYVLAPLLYQWHLRREARRS